MTLFLSVVLFIVIPWSAVGLQDVYITKKEGLEYFEKVFIPKFGSVTIIGLLLLLSSSSLPGQTIVNILSYILIAIPFGIQTYFIFFISYIWARIWETAFDIASPAGMIGASNFFELAVAVAISLFGLQSGLFSLPLSAY